MCKLNVLSSDFLQACRRTNALSEVFAANILRYKNTEGIDEQCIFMLLFGVYTRLADRVSDQLGRKSLRSTYKSRNSLSRITDAWLS